MTKSRTERIESITEIGLGARPRAGKDGSAPPRDRSVHRGLLAPVTAIVAVLVIASVVALERVHDVELARRRHEAHVESRARLEAAFDTRTELLITLARAIGLDADTRAAILDGDANHEAATAV